MCTSLAEAWAGVMIGKFASTCGKASSEFLDLNHTSKLMILVSLLILKFAKDASFKVEANFGIGTLAWAERTRATGLPQLSGDGSWPQGRGR